jgi:excisionase family DNA binding protein
MIVSTIDGLIDERIRAVVRDLLASEDRGDDWIDQAHSPLGRRTHCRLVREGVIPGVRVHRRVLVRRRDLDAYVVGHAASATMTVADDGDAEAIAFARVGARRVAR